MTMKIEGKRKGRSRRGRGGRGRNEMWRREGRG
jgi:hypothetical protein